MKFFSETRHLWFLCLLLVFCGGILLAIRSQLVPATFGDRSGRYGPYRHAALAELRAKASVLISDSVCHQCHQDIAKERAGAKHKTVRCIHCHGLSQKHVVAARTAAATPGTVIPSAEEWDGNFLTKVDLYITRDRATCLVCHGSVVGMPEGFQKIQLAEHLEDMGAEEPESRNVCFECHGGHNTEP